MTAYARPHDDMSARTFQAWVNILKRHRDMEYEARSLRLRVAHEVGFDVRPPAEVKPGDRIRPSIHGGWYEVRDRFRHQPEDPSVVPYWRFWFDPAERAHWDVADVSEDNPVSALVVVAIPDDGEPF